MEINLTRQDKLALLKLAREVIEARAGSGQASRPALPVGSPALQAKAGVFVSLHKKGALRGCIGYTSPELALAEGVARSAANAAFDDSRFSPVSAEETAELEIEISILTPPQPVESHERIVLGKHGIILEKYGSRALFLPQVPTEYGWDLPTTLTHLASKAGLPPEAWRAGARFSVFESIVFSESSL